MEQTFYIIRSVYSTTSRKLNPELVWAAVCDFDAAERKRRDLAKEEKGATFELAIKIK